MKQNILNVAVTAAPETDGAALPAGKMYEHNAAAVCFLVDESLICLNIGTMWSSLRCRARRAPSI